MDRAVARAAEAVADVPDGASPAVGGFGLSGVQNVGAHRGEAVVAAAAAGVRCVGLAAHAIRALLARTPEPAPRRIDDVYVGNANGAGEENRNVGRVAHQLARRGGGTEVATLRIGVGQGLALVPERQEPLELP